MKAPASAGAQPLFLEAGTGAVAIRSAYLAIVRADFRHCSVTPAVADVVEFLTGSGKHLVLLSGYIHFFRSKMLAEVRIHNQAVSCASVRRTSARTMGTL